MNSSAPRKLFSVKYLFAIALGLIFALGLGVRFFDLGAPLLDFHPTRQLFSAIRARGIYYQTLPNAPAWQKDMAKRQLENTATIEPPIMENAAAFFYSTFGGEQTGFPRAFSATFWAVGGIFLFLLACNLTGGSSPGAAAALALYMFIPYSLRASRAFQPDPLMVMCIIIFWWAIENWGRKPASWKWTLLSGISGGLAIFVKFPAAFFVIGGALGVISIYIDAQKNPFQALSTDVADEKKNLRKSAKSVHKVFLAIKRLLKLPQTWLLILLGALPSAVYLYYGLFVEHFLGQQFEKRFYPEMLISPNFYLRWFLKVDVVVGVFWLALALLGCLVFSSRATRIFLLSLFGGYFVFGLVFDYHISSHDYYSLPLIPIVALAFAPIAADLAARMQEKLQGSRLLVACTFIVFLITFGGLTVLQYSDLRENDYRPQAAFWTKVGAAIKHQPGVIAITGDYGDPLKYYGWQNSDPWPLAVDIPVFAPVFARLAAPRSYFLITDFDEFDLQPALKKRLQRYPILASGKGYLVYDLLHPKQVPPTTQ